MNLLVAAALGLGLGVVTGMPLGVINVAVVDAAIAGHRRYATGVGAGGAIADAIHAALAFIGVGAIVTARPELVRILAAAAAALVVGYAIVMWRRRAPRTQIDASRALRGVGVGFLLTIPNPAALAAWVAVAAAVWPDASIAEAVTIAVGVGAGSTIWFAWLARWISRVRSDHPALAIIPRVAIVILVAVAALGVVRVLV